MLAMTTSIASDPAPRIAEGYPVGDHQRAAWSAMWRAMGDGKYQSGPELALRGAVGGEITPKSCREILRRAVLAGILSRSARPTRVTDTGPQRMVAYYARRSAP